MRCYLRTMDASKICPGCKMFIPENSDKHPQFIKEGGIGYCKCFEESDPDSAYIYRQDAPVCAVLSGFKQLEKVNK